MINFGVALAVIGAAALDQSAWDTGLDAAMIERVAKHAKRIGYTHVQAMGWSESRVFATWGQQLPASAYQAAGFASVSTFTA